MAEISPLPRRMVKGTTVRDLSPAPQQLYIYAVSQFSRNFGCSPDRPGLERTPADGACPQIPNGVGMSTCPARDGLTPWRPGWQASRLSSALGRRVALSPTAALTRIRQAQVGCRTAVP